MAISQNGWALVSSDQLDKNPIPGTNIVPVPGVLEGDVAWLLHWVGTQFNAHVANLYNPGCWGWNAPTLIPGSNIYSNHCSGTAIDFNAPSFPWTKRTMTPEQRQACRVIVSNTEGIVTWGGDFTTVVDEMHFEISGRPEDVARIVNKLKGDDMIENNDSEYDRWKLAVRRLRGGPAADRFTREYFNSDIVGQQTKTILDSLLRAPEADYRERAGDIGNLAIQGDWWNKLTQKAPAGGLSTVDVDKAVKEAQEALDAVNKLKGE